MLFDTWGGSLSGPAYREYSLAYMREIVSRLVREREGARVPVIVFTKGGGAWLEEIAGTGCDVVGLDWTIDLSSARVRAGDRAALQGNLDPAVLFAPPSSIEREVAQVLADYGAGAGHIFNLGHGVSQHTDPDHVLALVEAVHALSRRYH
jgi:uroporphyrinogen decarboxylase